MYKNTPSVFGSHEFVWKTNQKVEWIQPIDMGNNDVVIVCRK